MLFNHPGKTKIVLSSNFTIEPIKIVFNFWFDRLQIIVTPFQQILQSMLDVDAAFCKNENGANFIFIRLEDCWPDGEDNENRLNFLDSFLDDFDKALVFAENRHSAPLFIVECPASKEIKSNDYFCNQLSKRSQQLKKNISTFKNIYFISERDIFDLYPMKNYEDPFAYKQGRIPYNNEGFTALGTLACRKLAAVHRRPYKVVVLDCDNTLWGGACGEDDINEIAVNGGFEALQKMMVKLHDQGFLLCLCSKNFEQDVWAVFEKYEGIMPLSKTHIVSWRINWLLKSENIKSLAQELNLGLDSFIFLDDSETQCAEVRANCSGVECFQVPKSAEIPVFLQHIWLLDREKISLVDKERVQFYMQNSRRNMLEKQSFNFEEFLDQLQLHLEFSELEDQHLDRVIQMVQRTNQFNLTGEIISMSTLKQSYLKGRNNCLLVDAKDRYGNYGSIACVFYEINNRSLYINNLLVSCRALGKKIEYKIWEHIKIIAQKNVCRSICLRFIKTKRNDAALMFIEELGLQTLTKDSAYQYEYIFDNR